MPNKVKLKNIIKSFQTRINKIKFKKMTNNNMEEQEPSVLIATPSSRPSNPSTVKLIFLTASQLFHRFFLLIARLCFRLFYGDKGKSMPPIQDLTLMESATSLAYKIRTRKVNSYLNGNSDLILMKKIINSNSYQALKY